MLNRNHLLLFTLFTNLGLSIAVLPLAQAERVKQVVIVSFDGLRADALTSLGPTDLPTFYQVIQDGASTLNARADYYKTETLPNHATMLTGRGVLGDNGHQHSMNKDNGQTLHSVNNDNYVHSLFDVAHDYGLKTALLASKDKFPVFYRSYDEINGAPDLIGVDNGKKKIDVWEFTNKNDLVTRDHFLNTITSSQPPQLTFLHFSGPDKIGHTNPNGWDITPGSPYMNTVKQMDTFLQQVLDNVPSKTVVIATADHGGGEPTKGHHVATQPVNYTIPFFVWDNMNITKPNSDLYNLNPIDYTDPSTGRPDYDQAQQPIRNGDVANLALSLLCLPEIPNSFIKGKLALNDNPNRAPLLTNSSTPSLTSINEDDTNPSGMVVADLIAGLITEPDFSCALEGIAVIAVDNSNGSWEYSIDTGLTWNSFGNPSESEARLLAADTQIRFIPNANYYGKATMTFRAWDQTSGSHGNTADATNFGDSTAFSKNTLTPNITIEAINDAPSFTAGSNPNHVAGSSGNQTIPSWATAMNPGAANESSQILTFHVTIINDLNQVLTTVPTISSSSGDLNYTLTGNSGTVQLEVVLQDDGETTLGGIDTSSATIFTITVNGDSGSRSGNNPPPPVPILPPTPNPTLPPGLKPLPPTMKLTVLLSGSGKGRVISEPLGIDCDNEGGFCQKAYKTASWVKLTPIAIPDSKFRTWGGQSGCKTGEVFMNAPHNCIAYFDLLRVPLTITITGQGKVSSKPMGINCENQCRYIVDVNTKVTLTAEPENGWQFQKWDGDCNQEGQVVMKEGKTCQAIFSQSPAPSSPLDPILTACADAITWDGQTNPNAVVKNTGILDISGNSTIIKVKALCNYGTIQATTGKLLSIRVNPRVGFIYNEGSILGNSGASSTAKSTIPTNLVNRGNNGSSIKLKAGTQLYNTGLIQAGSGGNGYLRAGRGGSVAIYADNIFQAGIIAAGHGGEGNAHQPEWDGVWDSETDYGNRPVWGGKGGKTLLYAKQSLHATATATTWSGTGGNAYVWCRNGANLTDWWFDGRWWAGTCVSDSNRPIAIPTPGKGGDLIQLSPSLYDLSQASSGKGLYYEPNTITLGTETQLQAQEDIRIFGGNDWVLDLRNLSQGAISTPGNITLAVGPGSIIDLRGNTEKIFQTGGQFTVFTDTPILLEPGIALADLVEFVDSPEQPLIKPSQIFYLVVLTGPEQLSGVPQATLPIELELVNGSPQADVYNLTVSDSAGWNLTALPASIPVEALGHETLSFNVTLPATSGEQDTITITATSQTEPTVTSSLEFTAEVATEPTSSDTLLTTALHDSNTVAPSNPTNSTITADEPEIPLSVTNHANQTSIAAISVTAPPIPSCYASGFVDWVCNANGQQITDLTVGPNGILADGTLIGTLINQGWVSNLTLGPHSRLIGGIVTGYIINHGEMADFEFRGAAIVGGKLAGEVFNTSEASVGGYFRDVQLASGTYLSGGQLFGHISGNPQAPALLEHLEIEAGSYLEYVTIGDKVKLASDGVQLAVTLGEQVVFINPDEDPRLASQPSPNFTADN
jgi:hypothetical protein